MTTYGVLQFAIFFLGVDEFLDNVECAGEDKGEEETEAGEVGIALGALLCDASQSKAQQLRSASKGIRGQVALLTRIYEQQSSSLCERPAYPTLRTLRARPRSSL